MDRKFYEEPTIVILKLENEVWFTDTTPSMNYGGEGSSDGTGTGSDGFDPFN